MITRFVTLEVPLTEPADLQRSILATLEAQGEPLRWAITAVDHDRQAARIEAVVLSPTQFAIPFSAVTLA
ncbi:hypothetical protein [Leptolyngbya ohadii]|uniref:hypothetical protein n=1 Tax=Leptolyngbya ohadii TaxID=1962290 RepID=UPI000B5A20E4|nr:hypothetical protein [Leptolyngbya ohadii]